MTPAENYISLNGDAPTRMDTSEIELTEDIRKLIESVTQGNTSGAWSNSSGNNSMAISNGRHAQNQPDHDMDDAPDSEQRKSATASRRNSTSPKADTPPPLASQPQFVIFGSSEDDLAYIIPKKSLANLPQMVMRHLAMKGNLVGPSIYMTNYDQLESMKRLKEYLDDKSYSPFRPKIPLDLVLADGMKKTWEPSPDIKLNLRLVKVTDETLDLLIREIDLYLFAMEVGFEELRQASLQHIIHGYPKSIKGVWELIERLFIKSHRADRVLRQHILDLINTNRAELTALESYATFMRRFLKIDGALGEALFSAFVKAADDSRRRLAETSNGKEPILPKAEKPVPKEPASTSSRRASIPTKEPHSYKSDIGWPSDHLRPSDLPKLSEALLAGQIIVAKRSGYGTLVKPGASRERNKGFQFSAGELLLVNTLEATTSARNIIVYNSFGEKGDVLSDILSPLPEELGVSPRDREWGQLYQHPRNHETIYSPATTATGSSGFHPDREERLFREERRRSMSPSRRRR